MHTWPCRRILFFKSMKTIIKKQMFATTTRAEQKSATDDSAVL